MLALALLIAFLAVPILEIYVIIQAGVVFGAGWTVLALLAGSMLGGAIIKREGRRAWRALQGALTGELPGRQPADSALVMAGGLLLLIPGFITDVLGLVFVLPLTRPLVRRALAGYLSRRIRIGQERLAGQGLVFPVEVEVEDQARHEVIRGEIVREDGPET